MDEAIGRLALQHPELDIRVRGRGLIRGVETRFPELGRAIAQECFTRGLILETCGGARNIIKLLPPLNIPAETLDEALALIAVSVEAACAQIGAGIGVGRSS